MSPNEMKTCDPMPQVPVIGVTDLSASKSSKLSNSNGQLTNTPHQLPLSSVAAMGSLTAAN